jgi:hypothetical protein
MKAKHHKKQDGSDMSDSEEFAASGLSRNKDEQKELLIHRGDTDQHGKVSPFERIRARFMRFIKRMIPYRKPIVITIPVRDLSPCRINADQYWKRCFAKSKW